MGLWMMALFDTLHLQHLLESKAGHPQGLLIDHQNIGGIQETMHNTLAMCMVEARCYLLHHLQRAFWGKALLVLDNFRKPTPLDERCHYIRKPKLPPKILHRDNDTLTQTLN